jgi:hypothetical protein
VERQPRAQIRATSGPDKSGSPGLASTVLAMASTFARVQASASRAAHESTRLWLERVVIGLGLCPFAKAVQSKNQIRYVVSEATTTAALREDLARELLALSASDPEEVDTTLLIHPYVLADFLDYNDFLDEAEAILEEQKLAGKLQIATFHPLYQFAGSAPDDIANYTNRSPHPMLHLLREQSITRALEGFAEPSRIFEGNIERLNALGHEGLRKIAEGKDKP